MDGPAARPARQLFGKERRHDGEVELARTASAGASGSISCQSARFTSSFSGAFSCTQSMPSQSLGQGGGWKCVPAPLLPFGPDMSFAARSSSSAATSPCARRQPAPPDPKGAHSSQRGQRHGPGAADQATSDNGSASAHVLRFPSQIPAGMTSAAGYPRFTKWRTMKGLIVAAVVDEELKHAFRAALVDLHQVCAQNRVGGADRPAGVDLAVRLGLPAG